MAETKQTSWRGLYRDAMLESDPDKLRHHTATAYKAIRARLIEIRPDGTNSEEHAQLDCALYFLGVLRKYTEKERRERSPNHVTAA